MQKIKADRLLVSGDSWLDGQVWFNEIFDYNSCLNLAVEGSGNKWIAESVISYLIENKDIDYVFVNWSGLLRVDIALPLTTPNMGNSDRRITPTSKYWTNIMAPWRDKAVDIQIEEKIVRMMYQEKQYTSVKNQSLLSILHLQNFLKNRKIKYLFCFSYDYTNQDFDHNHLTGESPTGSFSTLRSIRPNNVLYKEIDMKFCLTPPGIDWALTEKTDHFKDATHLTHEGYRQWAHKMLQSYY